MGSSGTPVASAQVRKADVLLVLGASFSRKTSIPTDKTIIQVDLDPMILGKTTPVTLPIWADIKTVLEVFCQKLPQRPINNNLKQEISILKENWRREKQVRAQLTSPDQSIPSAFIFSKLSEIMPDDAVITVDVGNNAYAFGRYFEVKNQEIILSGYLGSIGFAFPAALGASQARPHKKIVAIAGDGGFGQYLGEFTTAVHYKLPITLILLNNHQLAKITAEQLSENFPKFGTDLTNPPFHKFADLCGGKGFLVEKPAELEDALKKAFSEKTRPTLVEIISDPRI